MGLLDLSRHNCTTRINPAYMRAHHLKKTEIESWYRRPFPIHILTDNLGLSKYDVQGKSKQDTKSFNQTIYDEIRSLSACPGCLVVMNVGIHDMTLHTKTTYLEQHPSANPDVVFRQLEDEFMHNLENSSTT